MMVYLEMPRFRSRLHPVDSRKHIVDKQAGVVLNVLNATNLALAKDAPVLANTEEVRTSCHINSIFLNVQCSATTAAALANVYLVVFKNPGGNLPGMTPNTMGSNDDKRYAIHQEMVMIEKAVGGNPRTLFKGVIRIPRGYSRMAVNDIIGLNVIAPGVNIDLCIQCIYKEYS